MKNVFFLLFATALFYGCEFNKSIKKDLMTGLTTQGDGISAEDVFITVNDKKISRTTFVYGEEMVINVEGLQRENGKAFPGIRFVVISQSGDTAMATDDLYTQYDTEGITISPLRLTTSLVVANPVKSNEEYTIHIKIWDKKSKGTYTAKLNFKVETNKNITIEKNKAEYTDVYLFAKETKSIVIDEIYQKETVYMMFEGLSGFTEIKGMVFPGLGIKGIDKSGSTIVDVPDLFSMYTETGVNTTDFKEQVSARFNFEDMQLTPPVKIEVVVWDKKGDAKVKAVVELKIIK